MQPNPLLGMVMLLFLVGPTAIIGLGKKKSGDDENAAKVQNASGTCANTLEK